MSNPWRRAQRPLVIAHRGHSAEAPENTLPAFERAIALGAEMIEADVHLTRDGQLVMLHDSTLDRTTNGHGRVSAVTWDELQQLDAGSWFDPAYAATRIPTTDSLLALAREAGIWLCLEVKGADQTEAIAIAQTLADLLQRRDALEWAFLSSYDHAALAAARATVPGLLLAPERLPDHAPADPPEALRQARALHAPVIQHHYARVTPALIDTLHAADLAIWSWTVNDQQSLVAQVAAGVDGIMSDDVRLLKQTVDRLAPQQSST